MKQIKQKFDIEVFDEVDNKICEKIEFKLYNEIFREIDVQICEQIINQCRETIL